MKELRGHSILSKTTKEVPDAPKSKAELYDRSIELLCKQFQNENCKGLYIDDGKIIQSFIRSRLVTDMIITKIPVLI